MTNAMRFSPDHHDPGYRIDANVLSDRETSELLRSLEASR
jgi:hypothetical protein